MTKKELIAKNEELDNCLHEANKAIISLSNALIGYVNLADSYRKRLEVLEGTDV